MVHWSFTSSYRSNRSTLMRLVVIVVLLIAVLADKPRLASAARVVIATVPVGSGPDGVGVNATTNRIYVANFGGSSVSVIDGATNTVFATVGVGNNPEGVSVNETTNRIYVANHAT